MNVEIPISNSDKKSRISAEDFEKVGTFSWHVDTYGYAVRMIRKDGKRKKLFLHREILSAPDSLVVDHVNHDILDNTRENIRLATRGQNCMNRRINKVRRAKVLSQFKGVAWNPLAQKWHATIAFLYRRISLGYFVSEKEAASAYNKGAVKYFGEFAHINQMEVTS